MQKDTRCLGRSEIPSYWNHSELEYINQLAMEAGAAAPFPFAEKLIEDMEERFFSVSIWLGCLTVQLGLMGEICAFARSACARNAMRNVSCLLGRLRRQ